MMTLTPSFCFADIEDEYTEDLDIEKVTRSLPAGAYRKQDILDARYGSGDKQRLLQSAYELKDKLSLSIISQDQAVLTLQASLIRYLEGYPNHQGAPVHLNFVGMPGVGKTSLIAKLKEMGFPVIHFDVQHYVQSGKNLETDLKKQLEAFFKNKKITKPLIVAIEEIDKTPEYLDGKEITSPIIGTINQIVSEGVLEINGTPTPISNVMFLTTMNFSPKDFQDFSKEVFGIEKPFYDFTTDDFQHFDQWVKRNPSARYRVMTQLFRPNTISRLAPNTVIMESLSLRAYRQIIRLTLDNTIRRLSQADGHSRKIQVQYDESLLDLFSKVAIYAPSGARETLEMVKKLAEQLVHFAIKYNSNGIDKDRPHKIKIAYDAERGVVNLDVISQIYKNGNLIDKKSISFPVVYNPELRLFETPVAGVSYLKPVSWMNKNENPIEQNQKTRRPSKAKVFSTRFPMLRNATKGLVETVKKSLIGQDPALEVVRKDLDRYFNRIPSEESESLVRVFSGFPGIGKTEMIESIGKVLNIPVIKINLQQYITDDSNVVGNFVGDVQDELHKILFEAYETGVEPKYILLIEEMDKAFEISPDGNPINRPIMAAMKDLLNNGQTKSTTVDQEGVGVTDYLDIRSAYTVFTMNFSTDRFDFAADPRFTTAEDMFEVWKKITHSPMSIKRILSKIFLPETVSRIMPRIFIMNPLLPKDYKKIINLQKPAILSDRFVAKDGVDQGQIQIEMTPAYRQYLYGETVIPSEGARNTSVGARALISQDLDRALTAIPRTSKYAKVPIVLTFDYSENKSEVIIRIRLSSGTQTEFLTREKVALKFQPFRTNKKMTEERLHTATHEFGHAYMGLLLGERFDNIVIIPPSPEIGGYVKFYMKDDYAESLVARIYMSLASRVFERLFMSPQPLDRSSVLSISSGASGDIEHASEDLFETLYKLGMNPYGGVLERTGGVGPSKYANFADLPHQEVQRLGFILGDLEDYMMRDFLSRNSKEWYIKKIIDLAKAGEMKEKNFFELVGVPYPGEGKENYARPSLIKQYFSKVIKADHSELEKARSVVQPIQTEYMAFFKNTLEKYFLKPRTSTKKVGMNFEERSTKVHDKALASPMLCKSLIKF